jgi:endonuclease V-like protein UPF0215 family
MKNSFLLKPLARAIAIDDGYFEPKTKGRALLVGVIARLDNHIEGIVSTKVSIDGFDSTKKIIEMLKHSRFQDQAKIILLSGINFAGFNIVDLEQLYNKTRKPILVVFRKAPNLKKFFSAIKKTRCQKKRIVLAKKAGKVFEFQGIHFQCYGFGEENARLLIKRLCHNSLLPEPIRIAHLVASGISIGESTRQ